MMTIMARSERLHSIFLTDVQTDHHRNFFEVRRGQRPPDLTRSQRERPIGKGLAVVKPDDLSPRCLTIQAAAEYLSVAVWAVREMIWRGELPFVKVGKRFVIDRSDLDAWIDGRKQRN